MPWWNTVIYTRWSMTALLIWKINFVPNDTVKEFTSLSSVKGHLCTWHRVAILFLKWLLRLLNDRQIQQENLSLAAIYKDFFLSLLCIQSIVACGSTSQHILTKAWDFSIFQFTVLGPIINSWLWPIFHLYQCFFSPKADKFCWTLRDYLGTNIWLLHILEPKCSCLGYVRLDTRTR